MLSPRKTIRRAERICSRDGGWVEALEVDFCAKELSGATLKHKATKVRIKVRQFIGGMADLGVRSEKLKVNFVR
jgi:hypothetical protein